MYSKKKRSTEEKRSKEGSPTGIDHFDHLDSENNQQYMGIGPELSTFCTEAIHILNVIDSDFFNKPSKEIEEVLEDVLTKLKKTTAATNLNIDSLNDFFEKEFLTDVNVNELIIKIFNDAKIESILNSVKRKGKGKGKGKGNRKSRRGLHTKSKSRKSNKKWNGGGKWKYKGAEEYYPKSQPSSHNTESMSLFEKNMENVFRKLKSDQDSREHTQNSKKLYLLAQIVSLLILVIISYFPLSGYTIDQWNNNLNVYDKYLAVGHIAIFIFMVTKLNSVIYNINDALPFPLSIQAILYLCIITLIFLYSEYIQDPVLAKLLHGAKAVVENPSLISQFFNLFPHS